MHDSVGVIDEKGHSTDPHLDKKINNAFFKISEDNAKLQKIMRGHKKSSLHNIFRATLSL